MPSLQDAIQSSKSLSGYEPVPTKPPVLATVPTESGPSTNLRCPLPPFNADPDSLRQFEDSSTGPKNRIWPQPQKSGSVSTTTVVTNQSTSTSSSSSTSNLQSKIVGITTGLLPASTVFQGSVTMAQSFQLLSLTVSGPCEVRLYGSQAAQSIDAYRVTGAPVAAEVTGNIITCVTFDTAPYVWGFQSVVGSNQNIPQTTAIYVSVLNTNPLLANAVTATIKYLPLEAA